MIENKLQYYQTYEGYKTQKDAHNIPNDSLVFIEDTQQIVTHGEEGFGGAIRTEDYSSAEPVDVNLNDAVLTVEQELSETQKSIARANILDKETDQYAYSKLGRVILPKHVVNGHNTLTQDMFYKDSTATTSYDITIDSSNAAVINDTTYYYEEVSLTAGQTLTLVDATHCVLLNSDHSALIDGTTVTADSALTVCVASTATDTYNDAYTIQAATRVPRTDTIYVIEYDYELAEDITIPANCVLQFDGGSIDNGNLNPNGAFLRGDVKFGNYLTISGNIGNAEVWANWWADTFVGLKKLINSATNVPIISKTLKWNGLILVTEPIVVPQNWIIEGADRNGLNFTSTLRVASTFNDDYVIKFEYDNGSDWSFRNGLRNCYIEIESGAIINNAAIFLHKTYESILENIRVFSSITTKLVLVSECTLNFIKNCTFYGNSSGEGMVGIHNIGGYPSNHLVIEDCDIEVFNIGIQNSVNGNIVVKNSFFERSTIQIKLDNGQTGSAIIEGCSFSASNISNGGCYLYGYNGTFKDCRYKTTFGQEYFIKNDGRNNHLINCNYTSLREDGRNLVYENKRLEANYSKTFNKSEIEADKYYPIAIIQLNNRITTPIEVETYFGDYNSWYNKFTFDVNNMETFEHQGYIENVRDAYVRVNANSNFLIKYELVATYGSGKITLYVKPLLLGSLVTSATFTINLKALGADNAENVYFQQIVSGDAVAIDSANMILKAPIIDKGNTADRPNTPNLIVGFKYFDNSLSPKRPVFWNGSAWVDATGTPV